MSDQAKQGTSVIRRFEQSISTGEITMPSLRDVLRIGFRYKWMILVLFVGISAGGVVYAMQLPDYYRSSGSVMLRDERGSLAISAASEELVTAAPQFNMNPSGSEYAILKSQDLAEEVIRKVGPGKVLELGPNESVEEIYSDVKDPVSAATRDALKVFSKNLAIKNDGQVIEIAYTHGSPTTAQEVVNQILDTYQNRHIAAHTSSASPEFVRESLAKVKTELEEKQAELKKLQDEYGVSSITPEKESLQKTVGNLDEQLTDTRIALEASQGRLDQLTVALGGRGVDTSSATPTEVPNPEVVALRNQLYDLKAEKLRVESIYVSGTQLRSINAQVEAMEAKIKSLPATVPRSLGATTEAAATDPAIALEQEKVAHSGLVATKNKLEEELSAARSRLKGLEEHEWPLSTLEAEVERLSRNYLAMQEGLGLTETELALNKARVSNVSILQAATLPNEPEGPRRKRLAAMAMFMGLAAGLGLAFVREVFDATIKSREEAEKKLGLTVLAVVPEREFRECI